MAIENKAGMQGPMTITIRASKAAEKDGNQLKGKYPPHKDLPKWYCNCSEPHNASISVYSAQQPKEGDTHLEAWVDGSEYNGKWYFELYTKEDKAKKDSGAGGKFGGGGIKPNLTPEQEIMDKAIGHAIGSISNGLIAGDGNPVPATFQNLDKFVAWAYKKISEAKKPESPQP